MAASQSRVRASDGGSSSLGLANTPERRGRLRVRIGGVIDGVLDQVGPGAEPVVARDEPTRVVERDRNVFALGLRRSPQIELDVPAHRLP